jgi:itaconyl-CoA hydratase
VQLSHQQAEAPLKTRYSVLAAAITQDEARPSESVLKDDTIYSPSVVFERRESESRKNVGIVTVRTTDLNRRGVAAISFRCIARIDQRGEGAISSRPGLD